jgi:AcrR family transcriptional regulator
MTDPDPPARTGYTSKLRAMQKEQTGHLILAAVAKILNRADLSAVTVAEVAQVAEVTERTIYRHFSTREDLLKAFWSWQLRQAAGEQVITPRTVPALLETVQRLFASLDADAGVIRAMLSSPEGRDIRLQTNRARYNHMLAFIEALLPDLPEHERHSLASGIVVVCSVVSWMFMRDHCGYDGVRAGEAAAYTVRLMIEAARLRSPRGEG